MTAQTEIRSLRTIWVELKRRIDALWGYDVFIAHRRVDAAWYAKSVYDALRRDKISCFIDVVEYGPGDSLLVATRRHVRKSSVFLLLGSPALLQARRPVDWVENEIDTYLRSHQDDPKVILVDVGNVIESALSASDAQSRPILRQLAPFIRISQPAIALSEPPSPTVLEAVRNNLRGRRRDRTRLLFFQAVAALLAALLGITAIASFLARRNADRADENARRSEEARKIAVSRELAAYADTVMEGDRELGLNLAVRGAVLSHTAEAERSLRRALWIAKHESLRETSHLGSVDGPILALSTTGRYAVARNRAGQLTIWRVPPPVHQGVQSQVHQVMGQAVLTGSPQFSFDETLLGTLTAEGLLRIWAIESERQLASFENVQTFTFAGAGTIAYLPVSAGTSSREARTSEVVLWDQRTGGQSKGFVALTAGEAPHTVFCLLESASLCTTVDRGTVSTWNFYSPGSLAGKPQSLYMDDRGIDRAWVSERGTAVVTTNAFGSALVRPMNASALSRIPLSSLRTVSFNSNGELMIAVSESGTATVILTATGATLAELGDGFELATAAAFASNDEAFISGSSDGTLQWHPCPACVPFERALEAAKRALTRPLTFAERQVYLHERAPEHCMSEGATRRMTTLQGACLELVPDSGPPGTVVEVRAVLLSGTLNLQLTDANGEFWTLPAIESGRSISTLSSERLGTLAIPAEVANGPATVVVVSNQSVRREFIVTCLWCDR